MDSAVVDDIAASQRAQVDPIRLFVAWQDAISRTITPVGCLSRQVSEDGVNFEYRYLRCAAELANFRPFVGFPEIARIYRSSELFPFFENRLVPRNRHDYSQFLDALALDPDADPFEVLARSEGRRQTDTIEVFPEPVLQDGRVRCRFLVHGVRHVPGAQDAIDSLAVGDELLVLPDPQNPVDALAVMLRDNQVRLLGWVPRYLTALVHPPLESLGPDAIHVAVEHVGERRQPVHLRLLCELVVKWPEGRELPFDGPEFQLLSSTV